MSTYLEAQQLAHAKQGLLAAWNASKGLPARSRMARLGFTLDAVSWVRPANASLLASLPAQHIPRRIVQIGRTFEHAANKHLRHMRAWWAHNPEYEYRFFSDAQCTAFVHEHAADDERRAYAAVVAGAQRADLFRGIYLRQARRSTARTTTTRPRLLLTRTARASGQRGGVYADLDTELRGALRAIVPPEATVVANPSWTFEFLIFAPAHPVVGAYLRQATANVLREAAKARDGAKDRCRGPHQCVIRQTQPVNHRPPLLSV